MTFERDIAERDTELSTLQAARLIAEGLTGVWAGWRVAPRDDGPVRATAVAEDVAVQAIEAGVARMRQKETT